MSRIPAWLIVLIVGSTLCLTALFAPVIPAHRECLNIYQERLYRAKDPMITPQQAAAVRAWAVENGCRYCGNSGRLSFLASLHDPESCVRFW
jgi:hypothetical protein